jgi:DNA invertase Pin-like site-specific DNA recombinase
VPSNVTPEMTVTQEEIFGPVVCLMRYDPEHEAIRIANGQAEGIAKAKQRGAYKGRKKSLGEGQILAVIDRAAGGEPKTVLAKEFGISRETIYAYLRTATL